MPLVNRDEESAKAKSLADFLDDLSKSESEKLDDLKELFENNQLKLDEFKKLIVNNQTRLEAQLSHVIEREMITQDSFDKIYNLLIEFGKKKGWVKE